MKKGLAVSDIILTALVLIIIGIMISLMLLINLINSYTSDPQGIAISFIKTINEPFNILEGLSHLEYRNRQVYEHLLEAAITGSLESGSGQGADAAVVNFISAYKKSIYIITLSAGERKIFERTSIRGTTLESISCGENAFCTENNPNGVANPAGGICQVGKIPDDQKTCSSVQTCCRYDPQAYRAATEAQIRGSKYSIVQCGKGKVGICNPTLIKLTPENKGQPVTVIPYCGNGFELIDDNGNCKDANNGATPVCCAIIGGAQLEKASVTQKADAAFLYKGKTLFEQKEYSCQDSRNEKCDGEYVRGLCPGRPDYVQCCLTDEIRCKISKGNEDGKYFCRDNSHCPGDRKNIIDNVCPDPDLPGVQSSYECCKAEEPYKEDNTGKAEPKNNWGSCYLTLRAGSSFYYNADPVEGKLEVSTR